MGGSGRPPIPPWATRDAPAKPWRHSGLRGHNPRSETRATRDYGDTILGRRPAPLRITGQNPRSRPPLEGRSRTIEPIPDGWHRGGSALQAEWDPFVPSAVRSTAIRANG